MSPALDVPPRVLVVIPAYNEAGSIALVIAGVRAEAPFADILVVDDGSTDGTAGIAEDLGATVARLPYNPGVGGAMRTGFRHAQREGYDAVVQVDADGQHDARYITALVAGLEHDDLVVGARFAGAGDYVVSGPRWWAMRAIAAVMTRLVGVRLDDATSGFRAAGRRAIPVYAHHYPTEYLGDTLETLVIARKSGLRVAQVPVAMHPRLSGSPSRGFAGSALDLARACAVVTMGLVRDWSIAPGAGSS
jgi:glycosyltransferase involved in cell wall biosynthesis